jgi:hypothetical protein
VDFIRNMVYTKVQPFVIGEVPTGIVKLHKLARHGGHKADSDFSALLRLV